MNAQRHVVRGRLNALIIWLPIAMSGALGAEGDALLFYCAYDGSAEATYARGANAPTHAIEPRFRPGVRGQALLIGGDPEAGQRIVDGTPASAGRARNCCYSPDRNIDLQQGSVSFWLKLIDWHGTDKNFNVVFRTGAGRNFFQIYKYWSDDRFLFLRGEQGTWTSTEFRIRNWQPGQWHHVAVAWSRAEMRMFIDGRMVCRRRVRFPLEIAKGVEPFSVGPGGSWRHAFIGHSLVDEFRIHSRPLSRAEVAQLYARDAASVELDSGKITIGKRTPAQDGRIDDFEYAFDSTGLARAGESVSVERSRYALSYDDANLYLAFLTPLLPAGGDDVLSRERIELFLCPPDPPKSTIHLVFAPSGKLTGTRDGEASWRGDGVRIHNTAADGVWRVETAIPFPALGGAGAPHGQDWRMNLARVYAAPEETVSLAPTAGAVGDRSRFITLAFRPAPLAIRIADWADALQKRHASDVSVRGADSQSAIRCEIITNTTKPYGLKTRSYPLFANGESTPWKSPAWRTGVGADFSLNETRIVEDVDGRKTILYRRESIYESGDPLKVFFLYTQARKRLLVSALRRADGMIRVRFIKPDGACAFAASREMPAGASYFSVTFDLDFEALTPGCYTVKVDHLAADGAATEAWQQAYRVPAPDAPDLQPYVDEEADKAPAPWTPVQVSGAGTRELRISTWGRIYDFSDGFLFSSLVSQGREVLAAPASLRLNGGTLTPIDDVSLSEPSVSEVLAEWRQKANLGVLSANSRIKVHFDGYCEIAMELAPRGGAQDIAALSLEIPLRGAAATLVRDNKLSRLIGGKSGAVGDYWHQDLTGMPFLWVGNNHVGFNWLAPNLDGWRNKVNSKRVELIRQSERVVLRLNLVDEPLQLSAPRTIRFGFVLTPSRPLDSRILRLRSEKDMEMWCQPWKHFAAPQYETADVGLIKRRSRGVDDIFLYLGVGLTSPFTPEWPWFAEEWRGSKKGFGEWTGSFRDPDIRNRCTYVGGSLSVDSFFNWMQHTRRAFFEKAKTPLTPQARNYYFDTGPSVSERYREQAINVYRMIRRTGPDAKIWSHQGWPRVMPMQHFTDIIVGGEGVGSQVGKQGNYYDLLTPEMFRATFSPYIWGIKMVFLDMTVRAMRENHPDKLLAFDLENPEFRRPLLHSYGYCLVHDVGIYDPREQTRELRKKIWAAQDALGWDEEVVFHPYWENEAVKRISPDSHRIMASAYTKDGNMLLAVLNDTAREQRITLELDLDKLGLKPGLEGTEVWRPDNRCALARQWQGEIPPRGLRLVLFAERRDE